MNLIIQKETNFGPNILNELIFTINFFFSSNRQESETSDLILFKVSFLEAQLLSN